MIFLPAPDRIEKIIEQSGLDNEIVFTKDNIFNLKAKPYLSAEEFISQLKPGERVLTGFLWESFGRPGMENYDIDNLVKVYSAQRGNASIVFRESFSDPWPKRNFFDFYTKNYDEDGITAKSDNWQYGMFVWMLGGFLWLFGLMIVRGIDY